MNVYKAEILPIGEGEPVIGLLQIDGKVDGNSGYIKISNLVSQETIAEGGLWGAEGEGL